MKVFFSKVFFIFVCQVQMEEITIFSYKKRLLYLYPYYSAYVEASAICESEGMRLIIFDEIEKLSFIKQLLQNVKLETTSFWCGGIKSKNGVWMWQSNGQRIFNFSIHTTSPNNKCLSFRGNLDDPRLMAVDCTQHILFLCEQLCANPKDEPSVAQIAVIGNVKYVMYYGSLTWPEAVNYCRQRGLFLSSVPTTNFVGSLSKEMLKVRPELNEAWVGATRREGIWIWVKDGTELVNTIDDFPPWNTDSNYKDRDCVLLRSERWAKVKFIKKRCSQEHNFICSIPIMSNVLQRSYHPQFEFLVTHNKKNYLFFLMTVTWETGLKLCKERDFQMLRLTNLEESVFLANTMYHFQTPIHHLWIGGKLVNRKWRWVDDNSEIPLYPDKSGFPPWCDDIIDDRLSCLNLDGKGSQFSIIYGLECHAKQATVCTQNEE